ncbi:10233_t:CDS:2 [Dentiscutata erythropus]|uniref:10233_t:CDS:1 n=1 Tax=Dentiscutata erythropus TaxID=1348616 RepID=A0A9N9HSW1_9GLOM|nr:10233_t:CDS:2 [Dentiscutata erythropus]
MDDYDYNEANTDNYNYNKDNTISPDDSASAIVRSDTLESNVTNPTNLCRKNIVDMIIRDELSFQFVEKQGFQNFLNEVLPNFTISADTVKQDVIKAYDKRKAFIKKELQNLQTITLDNAGSNNVTIYELVDYISQDSLININKKLFHNHYFAHILNLIVKDSLKNILGAINKIRNCVKAIQSTSR